MSRQRRRKKSNGFLKLVILALVLVAGGFFVFNLLFGNKGYDDQSSFEKYAKKYEKSIGGDKEVGTENSNKKFGKPVSESVTYPETEQKSSLATIKNYLDTELESFNAKYENISEEEKAAFLTAYESYETPHDAIGVAIHEKWVLNANENNEKIPKETVKTMNFSTKSGTLIPAGGILRGDWQKVVKKKLAEDIENASKLENADLSNFILTKKGLKFFFNPGIAANKSKGVVSAEISYDDLKDYTAKDIGSRVVDPSKPMVAVTYDDGPGIRTTAELLDLYEKEGVVCTFFEVGQNVKYVQGGADLLKRELSLGCEVGTHSWNHPDLSKLSDNQVKEQATKSIAAIKDATGQEPTCFRAPYGSGNNKISKIFGLPGINWTVDTLDWKTKNKDAIVSKIKSFSNLDGQVILMHSIYAPSVEASKEIVPWLKEKGYQLVTVSELLEYKYKETPKPIYYGYTFTNLNNKSSNSVN